MYSDIENVCIGQYVEIELDNKHIHEGLVLEILSKSKKKGVFVKLNDYSEGKVVYIFSPSESKRKSFSYWNSFIQSNKIFAIYDIKEKEFFHLYRKNQHNQLEIVACLFNRYEDAAQFLKDNFKCNQSDFTVKNAKRNDYVFNAFPKATHIRANLYRQISIDKFRELEIKIGR